MCEGACCANRSTSDMDLYVLLNYDTIHRHSIIFESSNHLNKGLERKLEKFEKPTAANTTIKFCEIDMIHCVSSLNQIQIDVL